MNRRKTTSLKWFFALIVFEMIMANLAHPSTPTIIKQLSLPAYTFGVAFAAMSLTNFLFSPFWGALSDQIGRIRIYIVCCVGYALGQFLFGQSLTLTNIIFARLLSGFFIGGISVTQLIYVLDVSSQEKRGINLTIEAAILTMASAIGYLIGGFIGEVSIPLMFGVQVAGLVTAGLLMGLIMKDPISGAREWHWSELIKTSNPFSAFATALNKLSIWLWLFFAVVLFATFGSTAYEQSFNYFIRDQFNFSPSYNGLLKAGFGIMGLIINSTFSIWIIRNTKLKWPLFLTIIGCFFFAGMVTLTIGAIPFVLISVAFFALNSIYLVLIQALAGKENPPGKSGSFMGLYNSVKALGMIFGSLIAGLIYAQGPMRSFMLASGMFGLAAIMLGIILFEKKQNN